jgi:hypothetical protein
MKTTFSSGVIVTSKFLNGAQQIYFDGQDLDWHYNPLGLESLVTNGPNGLDNRYVTLGSEQPLISNNGTYISGYPLSGNKVVTGLWSFGFNPEVNTTISQDFEKAPQSYLTNLKYENANGVEEPSTSQKYAALEYSDLITKRILTDLLIEGTGITGVDNGTY